MRKRTPWYSEGVGFECTGCGACCKRPGTVTITRDEAALIAEFRTGVQDAARAFAAIPHSRTGPDYVLHVMEGTDCPFLVENRCTIHPVKPAQCRTYPFWPEILTNPDAWAYEALDCEGMRGERPIIPLDEIEARLRDAT